MTLPPYPKDPILLVDDEPAFLRSLKMTLRSQGRIDHTVSCHDSREALELAKKNRFSLAILDLTMPYMSGEELLAEFVERFPEIPVIILTGLNQVELAVRCIKAGAIDYFVKTDDSERLIARIRQAVEARQLKREFIDLKTHILDAELRSPEVFSDIITRNRRMQNIFRYIEATAVSAEPILVTGESGVGKELAARAIHDVSRPDQPWVAINVAGLDDTVFSDTLFGHVRGGFTGAEAARSGMIETVNGGTLFLDEIGDLSLQSQIKLLRLIQEREYFPIGSDVAKQSQARFVFSTNVNLEEKIAVGEFRNDLYYRLLTHQIYLPPLRERRDDLPLLLDHFIREAAEKFGKKPPTPPAELVQLLGAYHFPGNIRELRGMVYNAISVHKKGTLSMQSFQEAIGQGGLGPDLKGGSKEEGADHETSPLFPAKLPTLKEITERLVDEALHRSQGNLTIAAQMLGITRQALGQRLKRKMRDD